MPDYLTDLSEKSIHLAAEEAGTEGVMAWSEWDHFEVVEDDEVTYTRSDLDFPLFNNVLFARFSRESAAAGVDRIIEMFQERGSSIFWWVGPSSSPQDLPALLSEKGLHLMGGTKAMGVALSKMKKPARTAPGLEIREIDDFDDLAEWSRVMAPCFGFGEAMAEKWLALHKSLGLGPDKKWRHFLAKMDGRPVATASIFRGERAVNLANVATHHEYRNLGIAANMTVRALEPAIREGYKIAVLSASPMGEPVYKKLGFKAGGGFSIYGRMSDED